MGRPLVRVALSLLFFTSLLAAASSSRAPKNGWAIVLDGGVADSCVVTEADEGGPLSGQCGRGKRKTKVVCLKEWREVAPVAEDGQVACEEADKPDQDATFEDCSVHCVVVGPGSSSWLERLSLPPESAEARDTVADCVALAANYTDDGGATQNNITRCLLAPGRYTDANITLAGKQDLVIEPLDVAAHNASLTPEETAVVFDGTEVLHYEHADYHQVWSEDDEVEKGRALDVLRPYVKIAAPTFEPHFQAGGVYYLSLDSVGQHAANQAMGFNLSKIENFVVDGIGIQRAPDYNTARQPCFEYDARKGDDAIPRPFSCQYAEDFFLNSEDWQNSVWGKTLYFYFERSVHWTHPAKFWLDALNRRLYVLTTVHWRMEKDPKYDNLRVKNLKPRVRVKVPSRATSFVISSLEGTPSKRVEIKGLHFLGSSVSLRGPRDKKLHSQIAIKGCRFLFSGPKSIELETTTKRGRGSSEPIELTDNTLEFGEGAIWYVASGASVKRNLLVGNAFADRPYYSFHSISQADTLEDNTLLYEGSTGGHLSFSHSNEARRNLWIGQGFLSKVNTTHIHSFY